MTEHASLNPDDLVFARLACSKLARMLQGVLSVGLPSLVTGGPEPKQWFTYRFHRLSALAVVLEIVVFKRPVPETAHELGQYSRELDAALRQLSEESLAVAPLLPGTTSDTLVKLRAAMIKVYDLLQTCAAFLGLDLPEISKSRKASLDVLEALPELANNYKSLKVPASRPS
jgi:hypothetical protein